MLEGMRCMLLCMLEAVEGEICLLEVEVMRCSLLYILEAMEDWLCLLEALEVLHVPRRCAVCYSVCWRLWMVCSVCLEAMRCTLLCMLEAVEGGLCLWTRWRCRR